MDNTHSKSLTSVGATHLGPWYVPDKGIRTQSATQRAAEIADWVTTSRGQGIAPDENALFTALHTCAFQAARSSRGNGATTVDRDQWYGRWHAIREYIVDKNLGLVYAMLRRSNSPGQDDDDRLSEAMFALARSVARFNPWSGFRFSTYACNAIGRALMRRGERENRRRRLLSVRDDVELERSLLERFFERSASIAELYAERLGRALKTNHADLTELETKIVSLRYQQQGDQHSTFKEIAEATGLSKERIRQVHTVALSKLRKMLEADPVLR